MRMDAFPSLSDSRVSHCFADLNGKRYHYISGLPEINIGETVFLIHGWPDLSMGWRNQIPVLLDMGYRVVVPDMMGYGGSDAPRVPPESIQMYSFKRAADDMRELAHQLGCSRIILGGHDWGGAIVYRIALWYPELVTHIFTVCTPYTPPSKNFMPLEDMVKSGKLPNFGYQLQLAGGSVEDAIRSKTQIKQFLNAMYGGTTPTGQAGFSVTSGLDLEALSLLRPTRLIDQDMLDQYADQYAKSGLHGTLNWYRNREQNHEDELGLKKSTIEVPVLFIQATKDEALPPAMSYAMEKFIPKLTRKSVDTFHWALWEKPDEVNLLIADWLKSVSSAGHSNL